MNDKCLENERRSAKIFIHLSLSIDATQKKSLYSHDQYYLKIFF